jgi:hypothetical protein
VRELITEGDSLGPIFSSAAPLTALAGGGCDTVSMDETFEHQDLRGQQKLNFRAIRAAAITAGGITFIMSGGAPWTTAGTMNAVMGRHFELPLLALLVLHLLVSLVYASIIGGVVYRLPLMQSLFVGVLIGLGLYALNRAMFHNYSTWQGASPEVQAAGAHFTFGLLAAAVYRAASVPKRIVNAPESVANAPVEGKTTPSAREPASNSR